MNNFERWFTEQQANGLVDMKVSVVPGKGITREKVQAEILAAEAAILAGNVRTPPGCPAFCDDDEIPEAIKAIFRSTRV